VRSGSDDSPLKDVVCERAVGDVTEPASLLSALEGVDLVFHLAGIRSASARDDFMRVNAEGTRLVCEAMVKAGARRLVLCSSLAASGPSTPDRPRVEEDPCCPEEWYGESKAEAERIAFGFADRLEVTACRPSRILGPGDHENLKFFRIVKKGFVLRLGGAPRRLSMVDVEDVVTVLILQAERREAVGEAFFASSDETLTLEEFGRLAEETLGVKARTVTVPGSALAGLGAAADLLSLVSGRKLPLSRKLARQLLAPGWTCSIEKSKRLLGYQPQVKVADSIRRSAAGYLAAGWL
jgi:nucleoside-diphosphate-sugar epimerase